MPRSAVDGNRRMQLRIQPEQKATLMQVAAFFNTARTDFIFQIAMRETKTVIGESERMRLSEKDSLLVLDLLENPPAPGARLRRAIAAMPESG